MASLTHSDESIMDGHEFEQAVGDGEVQKSLACCMQSMGSQRVRHDWATEQQSGCTAMHAGQMAGSRKINWEAIALVRWGWREMCHGGWGKVCPKLGQRRQDGDEWISPEAFRTYQIGSC